MPHFKVRSASNSDLLQFEVDRAGFKMLKEFIDGSDAKQNTSPVRHRAGRDRIRGALFAGAALKGWLKVESR